MHLLNNEKKYDITTLEITHNKTNNESLNRALTLLERPIGPRFQNSRTHICVHDERCFTAYRNYHEIARNFPQRHQLLDWNPNSMTFQAGNTFSQIPLFSRNLRTCRNID